MNTVITTTSSSSSDDTDFCNRFNTIISDHISSIQKRHLRRDTLNGNELNKLLHTLVQEFAPDTLNSFQDVQSTVNENRQQQETHSDHLIEQLLHRNEQFAEAIRIQQQQHHTHTQQFLENMDERLGAYIRFQERQERDSARFSQIHVEQNNHLISLMRAQQEQYQGFSLMEQNLIHHREQLAQISHRQQEQERNNQITERLLQHAENFTQLLVNQQQQHVRDINSLHQIINQSSERNQPLQRTNAHAEHEILRNRFNFDFNTLNKLVQTIVLLWILIAFLRN